jgi:ribA/ribD-fused uncharacterized protein
MKRPVQFRDPDLDITGNIIGIYEREFYVFSNFSAFQVNWKGRKWPTSEHAYQASRFFDTAPELVRLISKASSAHEAYKIAKANSDKAPKNWDKLRVNIMYEICKHKMLQNPYVLHKLLQTGDLDIVEDSPKDNFWGWGPNRKGRNELGKIWMKLRTELQSGKIKAKQVS